MCADSGKLQLAMPAIPIYRPPMAKTTRPQRLEEAMPNHGPKPADTGLRFHDDGTVSFVVGYDLLVRRRDETKPVSLSEAHLQSRVQKPGRGFNSSLRVGTSDKNGAANSNQGYAQSTFRPIG
jgi:hypothetical protein